MKIGILAYRQEPYISANTDIAYIIGDYLSKKHEIVYIGRKQDKKQDNIFSHNGMAIFYLNDKPRNKNRRINNILQNYGLYSLALASDIASLKRIVRERKIEALICVTAPNEDAIIAYKANLSIPIYMYQLDPFYNFYEKENIRYKRLFVDIIKSFNYIFTTDLLLEEYSKDDEISPYLNKVIYFNYPKLIRKDKINSGNPHVLIYAGSLYRGIRSHKTLIKLHKSISSDYQIVFCGGCDNPDDYKELQDAGIVCKGYCDKETLETELTNAGFLINIGNNIRNQLASKIVDYIATGKPIINIIQLTNCPTIHVLNKYPNHISLLYTDKCDNWSNINEFLQSNKNIVLEWDEIFHTYYEFTPEYITNQIIKVIENE